MQQHHGFGYLVAKLVAFLCVVALLAVFPPLISAKDTIKVIEGAFVLFGSVTGILLALRIMLRHLF